MPSRCQIKKIRPLLYSKYPPSSSKSGIKNYVGHREGCHSESYFQNKSEIGIKPVVLAQRAQAELTTFPMSNFNYEIRFRTTRGVLAIQKWSYFFDLTPGRYDSSIFPNFVSILLSQFRTYFWKQNSEWLPSWFPNSILRPDFELEGGYLPYKSGLIFLIWRLEVMIPDFFHWDPEFRTFVHC